MLTTFTNDEEKYFQINTYGSMNREPKDEINRSIQIDKKIVKNNKNSD